VIRRAYNHILGTGVGQSLTEAARPDTDYAASAAWQLRYATVMINDGWFHRPTVDDPDTLAREVKAGLAAMTDDNGDSVFRDVLLADEAYADPGPSTPKVIARPAQGQFPVTLRSPTRSLTSDTDNFEHRYEGFVAAAGPLFDEGGVEEMSIVDVLPTMLAALSEPLSPYFDGEVCSDILAESVDTTYLAEAEVPEARTKQDDVSAAARDEATEQRLADLGYLE
jgi:hypothetical protein